MDYYAKCEQAAARLRAFGRPDVAVVLGSGLGDFADRLTGAATTLYGDIPNWPAAAVIGHAGKLVVGTLAGKRVAALAGRAHYYEGYDLATVTFPIRVMGLLGVRTVILTNAAGGVNVAFAPGTLMVIDDHLNLLGTNPLLGKNDERFGLRFPDMTQVYSQRLRDTADTVSRGTGIPVAHGIYAAVHGPSYETPAEIRYLRTIGADAVGMSTVPEALVARHMGIDVLGVSCITNPAAGILPEPLKHDEVMDVAKRVRGDFARLLEGIIERI